MAKGTIVVISSHVMRGSVGLRAGAFALEVLGHPVWAVPTVTLPWHPGHAARAGVPIRDVPHDLAGALDALAASPFAGEVRAIVSGYLADAGQAQAVARFVEALTARPAPPVYTLDPVMGDGTIGEGRLYVPEPVAEAMRERLLPLADRVTPNAFELGWLTGEDEPRAALDALSAGGREVLATSWPALRRDRVGTLLRRAGRDWLAEHPRLDGPPHGLGDLTACLFAAHAMALEPRDALERTTAAVFDTLERSARLGADELAMEAALGALLRPRGRGEVREIRL